MDFKKTIKCSLIVALGLMSFSQVSAQQFGQQYNGGKNKNNNNNSNNSTLFVQSLDDWGIKKMKDLSTIELYKKLTVIYKDGKKCPVGRDADNQTCELNYKNYTLIKRYMDSGILKRIKANEEKFEKEYTHEEDEFSHLNGKFKRLENGRFMAKELDLNYVNQEVPCNVEEILNPKNGFGGVTKKCYACDEGHYDTLEGAYTPLQKLTDTEGKEVEVGPYNKFNNKIACNLIKSGFQKTGVKDGDKSSGGKRQKKPASNPYDQSDKGSKVMDTNSSIEKVVGAAGVGVIAAGVTEMLNSAGISDKLKESLSEKFGDKWADMSKANDNKGGGSGGGMGGGMGGGGGGGGMSMLSTEAFVCLEYYTKLQSMESNGQTAGGEHLSKSINTLKCMQPMMYYYNSIFSFYCTMYGCYYNSPATIMMRLMFLYTNPYIYIGTTAIDSQRIAYTRTQNSTYGNYPDVYIYGQ